jgi:hypothetical protein
MPTPQDYGIQSSIPKGAQYTIYCAAIRGDFHVERANKMKKDLLAATGMKDWYVVTEEAQSALYYGYYRAIDGTADKTEAERARRDRMKIDLMTDPMGNRPFAQALFVNLDAPDPTAPPEWNLVNAAGDCTLQIGAYTGSPDRKQAAIEAVRLARSQGIEAYYYHGSTSSVICVGHWPSSAYAITEARPAKFQTDPREKFIVPPMSGDAEVDAGFQRLAKEKGMTVLKPKVEILDESLRKAMIRFPRHAINGEDIKRVVNGREVYEPSQLVPIPRSEGPAPQSAMTSGETPQQPSQPYDPTYRPNLPRQTPPPQPNPTGTGRLRSFGEK